MSLVTAAVAAAVAVGSKLLKKKPKAPVAVRPPTRNAAADALRAGDDIGRRRGYAASILTSARGAESSLGGSKTALGRYVRR